MPDRTNYRQLAQLLREAAGYAEDMRDCAPDDEGYYARTTRGRLRAKLNRIDIHRVGPLARNAHVLKLVEAGK